MSTMQRYAKEKQVPLDMLRLIADSKGLCEAFDIVADHHYADTPRVTGLTTKQYMKVRESLVRAVRLAEVLYSRGFAICETLEEFVALVTLIEREG